tara:strand:+ start:277 stop:876 length:600 start_codon:yes stop_codon:yes gene_type:complete
MINKLVFKFVVLFGFLVIIGCTNANKSEENLKELDRLYGYCDNPHRSITGKQYEICKAREDAAGPDGEIGEQQSVQEIIASITGRSNEENVTYISKINKHLWQGAMDKLSSYSIKLVDSEIGYIETDWIYNKSDVNSRCLVKVQIRSAELISTGVSSNIICEEQRNNNWYNDEKSYSAESKRLTLSILSRAQELKNQNL